MYQYCHLSFDIWCVYSCSCYVLQQGVAYKNIRSPDDCGAIATVLRQPFQDYFFCHNKHWNLGTIQAWSANGITFMVLKCQSKMIFSNNGESDYLPLTLRGITIVHASIINIPKVTNEEKPNWASHIGSAAQMQVKHWVSCGELLFP